MQFSACWPTLEQFEFTRSLIRHQFVFYICGMCTFFFVMLFMLIVVIGGALPWNILVMMSLSNFSSSSTSYFRLSGLRVGGLLLLIALSILLARTTRPTRSRTIVVWVRGGVVVFSCLQFHPQFCALFGTVVYDGTSVFGCASPRFGASQHRPRGGAALWALSCAADSLHVSIRVRVLNYCIVSCCSLLLCCHACAAGVIITACPRLPSGQLVLCSLCVDF